MGDFKPLLSFGELCIARHLVDMLIRRGVSPVAVVTGYRGEELKEALEGTGALFVENSSYAFTDMFYSLKLGFEAVLAECDQVLVMPVDVPAVTEETIRQVMEAEGEIVRTCCGERRGHPVKLSGEMIRRAMCYQGSEGLKGFLRSQGSIVRDVRVLDEGSFQDADTREEYIRLLKLEGDRGQGYPDGNALSWLLKMAQMPEPVRRHSEAVSRKALSMAVKLQEAGILLDLNLIRSASLLHDMEKGKPDHAGLGARILRENGFPRAAEIVRQHHRLDHMPQKADETLIVYLADKMIQEDREVSLAERFDRSLAKCLGNSEAMKNHEIRRRQADQAYRIWEQSFVS